MKNKNLRIVASALVYTLVLLFIILPVFENAFSAQTNVKPKIQIKKHGSWQKGPHGPKTMPKKNVSKIKKVSRPWSSRTWAAFITVVVFLIAFAVMLKLFISERKKDKDSKKTKLYRLFMSFIPAIGMIAVLIISFWSKTYYHKINPIMVDFKLFGLHVRIAYYGIIYALGFVITYLWLRYSIKNKSLNFKLEELDTYFIYVAIGVVVGARIFEAIFYVDPWYNFFWWKQGFLSWSRGWRFIKVWEGGLSAHGGMAGAIISTVIFCRKKDKSFYEIMDIIVLPAALALTLGRFANYLNGELYGVATSGNWGVFFSQAAKAGATNTPRIPTQLFESFKNLLMFSILFYIRPNIKKPGMLAWLWVFLYGIFRFTIEFWKDFEIIWQLGKVNFTVGHILCLAMIGASGFVLFTMISGKKLGSILPTTDKIKRKPKSNKKKKKK